MDNILHKKDGRLLEIEKEHSNRFTINEIVYKNLHQNVSVTCNKCGVTWNTKLYRLKYSGTCKNCVQIEKNEKLHEKKKRELINDGIELCKERGLKFVGVDFKNGSWVIRYEVLKNKKNGEDYGVVEQVFHRFKNGITPKMLIGDTLSYDTNDWVEKAKKIHPEYDYSKVNYVNNRKSVTIICKKHGEFSINPKVFIKKDYVCPICKKEETMKTRMKKYIEQAKLKYEGKYEYDENTYVTAKQKMRIICPEHGEFWMSIYNHLKGSVCPECCKKAISQKLSYTTEEFIEKARKVHGDKYDYSKVEYVNINTKVCIICPEHGEFWQFPSNHLMGAKCPTCAKINSSLLRTTNVEDFIERARVVHGDKYDYSKVVLKKMNEKVCIICPEHGEFWQTPKNHLHGWGCKKCSGSYCDKDIFIERSKKIHGDKYDYSKVEYVNNKTKVVVICPEHGEFMVSPLAHSVMGHGCPNCKESHLERELTLFLEENGIFNKKQKRFDWLRNPKTNYTLPLDFYLPDHNIAIECQGEQHFIASFYRSKGIEYSEKHLLDVQYRDSVKRDLCKENGVNLIYFLNKNHVQYLHNVENQYFTSKTDLLSYIRTLSKNNKSAE